MKDMGFNKLPRLQSIIIAILSLTTIAAVSVSIWALFFRQPDDLIPPDYAPIEIDPNQKPIEGDNGDKMEVEDGGGAVSLTYSNEVSIDLSDCKAELHFGNPGKSTQDMLVQIVIRDQVIVQSGRLTPGNEVTNLNLQESAVRKLSVGTYEGKFVISYYNPETREKAIVNTEIPIRITVQE